MKLEDRVYKNRQAKYAHHEKLCKELNQLYVAKNSDYNDAFGRSFRRKGLAALSLRLEDKFMRFESLASGHKAEVKDESIRDTLRDMANYCIMGMVELDAQEGLVEGYDPNIYGIIVRQP